VAGGWRHARHLIVLALVVAAGLGAFLILRGAVVPAGFGKLGHYRAGAIDDNRRRPVSFAGQATCADCHDKQVEARSKGKHRIVSCEACHGPQARHADDPEKLKPVLPDTAILCRRCHEKDPAKPAHFPQVASTDHSGGAACNACHQPHAPKM